VLLTEGTASPTAPRRFADGSARGARRWRGGNAQARGGLHGTRAVAEEEGDDELGRRGHHFSEHFGLGVPSRFPCELRRLLTRTTLDQSCAGKWHHAGEMHGVGNGCGFLNSRTGPEG
jgi:hypothetical protein